MILDDLIDRVRVNINVESNEIGLIILGALIMVAGVVVGYYIFLVGLAMFGIGAILLAVGIYLKVHDSNGDSW